LPLHPLVAQQRRLAEWIVTAMREHGDQGRYFGILRDQTQRFAGLGWRSTAEPTAPVRITTSSNPAFVSSLLQKVDISRRKCRENLHIPESHTLIQT
jgi:hypothetical protein